LRANVQATVQLLEFCRARHLERLIMGSSSSVYGNELSIPFREDSKPERPVSPYGASKRSAELFGHCYAHLYGIKTAVLRLFTVYGPRQRPDLAIHKFASQISQGKPVSLYGEGSSARDYTYVSDIVDGVRSAMRWTEQGRAGAFEIFNLGGGHSTTTGQLVRLLEKALGAPAQITWLDRQAGDMRETLADISKSHRMLGYSPKVAIERGIDLFVKWFRAQTPSPASSIAA
jgi:UDP-glucuronate 4-epimerase